MKTIRAWGISILKVIIRFLGLKNVILMEAERGTRENVQAVFQEMIRSGWTEKYHLYLASDHPEEFRNIKQRHVSVIQRARYGDDPKAIRRFSWIRFRTILIIDENLQIEKKDPETTHVFLSHGSPVKSVHQFYYCVLDTDYMLSQAPFWDPINEYELQIPREKLVTLGFPRNDWLFRSQVSMTDLFGHAYRKVIVWYPTYRQHRDHGPTNPCHGSITIPVIHDEALARRVNEVAARYDILLVVKPHPVQDLSLIQTLELDHIKLIYDDFFLEHGITAHEFLAKTDAIISDYSSIVFDYLLTGKPVALTLEDYEEYREQVGFAIDMDILKSCSTMLDTPEDFDRFFRDLIEGNDPLREKREEVMHLTNQYTDGNSTKRVVDWLESLLKR